MKKISLFIILLLGIILYNSFFIVKQTEQVIVLEFGKPVKFKTKNKEYAYISDPGLKFKIPFIQEIKYFDKRILNFTATDKEVLDVDKKAVTVNAFAKYKIVNPLVFYEKVTNLYGIENKLDKIFEVSLRDSIGKITLQTLLTKARREIMQEILQNLSKKADLFGVAIFDVRIVRADLPKENSDAIFKRMFADRNKEAREYRAQGNEEAKIIESTANKKATIIKANAERDAQIIKGEGEAKSTKIFADAFSQDPEFYAFYRTMQAYKKSIKNNNTKLLISPDKGFLEYFNSKSDN